MLPIPLPTRVRPRPLDPPPTSGSGAGGRPGNPGPAVPSATRHRSGHAPGWVATCNQHSLAPGPAPSSRSRTLGQGSGVDVRRAIRIVEPDRSRTHAGARRPSAQAAAMAGWGRSRSRRSKRPFERSGGAAVGRRAGQERMKRPAGPSGSVVWPAGCRAPEQGCRAAGAGGGTRRRPARTSRGRGNPRLPVAQGADGTARGRGCA
jgi:hypothetical protein